MEELVNVYDEKTEEKTDKIITKTEAHAKGIWHSAIHIIIINKEKTKILLQKRCEEKKFFPNMWDISVGGHISANEEPLTTAKRELEEELGLNPKEYEFKFITKIKEEFINNGINSKEFVYVYLIIGDINTSKITLQKEEVSDFLWTTKEELNKLIENKVIINHKEEFELINEIIK